MEAVFAAVQYGDYRGEAAADNTDRREEGIQALAADHGIKGHVVAVSVYSGERGKPRISVFTKSSSVCEDIEAEAKANGGVLQVERHVLENASLEDLLKCFKRFDFTLKYRYDSVTEMQYET